MVITNITKTNQPYHPALGHIYLVEVSNYEHTEKWTLECYEDELIERFGYEKILNFKELVGEGWKSE